MFRLLICACFAGVLTSLCESAELEKIDLFMIPEGIRELADEAAPEVIWQHAFQERNGIDIQTGMSEDCWLLMGLNSKQIHVYIWYTPYADSPEVGTEISFDQMPDVVREAVKSDRPKMIPMVVYAVRESTGPAAETYYHVQGEPRGGETMLARFNSKGQLRQTNLVIPAYPKDRFQTVTSAAGRFTIEMPGNPQELVDEFTRPADKVQFQFHRFVIETGADTGYRIVYFDWPDSDVKGIEPQRLLQAFLKGDLKPTDKIVEEREITLDTDNIPGRYFLIQSSPQIFFSREQVYLSGNRLYRVTASDTKESVASDDANRFFDSFALARATEPNRGFQFSDWLTKQLRDEAMAMTDTAVVEPKFYHPTGAYALILPEGWKAFGRVDESKGYPYHIFQDQHARGDGIGFHVRVYAIPIPPGFRPTLDASVPLANSLAEGHLSLTTGSVAKLGSLDGRAFAASGTTLKFELTGTKLETIDVQLRGELQIAVGQDYLYIATAMAAEKDWEILRPGYDRMLAGFTIPDRPVFSRERPVVPERLEDVAERVKPSVPQILILSRLDPTDLDEDKLVNFGSGSGVIVTTDGYLVTNRHVVERDVYTEKETNKSYYRITYDPVKLVWDADTQLLPQFADVVAVSYAWDLALLKIRGEEEQWTPIPFADPARTKIGQKIMVAGWPSQSDTLDPVFTVNEGTLTAIRRRGEDGGPEMYTHSARTNCGNSGGLVYSLDLGGVVGIHSAGLISTAHEFQDLVAHAAVPLARVFEEFPQLIPGPQPPLLISDRALRAATYFQAHRWAAAQVECEKMLQNQSDVHLTNWLKLRILAQQGEPKSVTEPYFKAVEADPATKLQASLWRGQAAVQNADWNELRRVLNSSMLEEKIPDELYFYILGRFPGELENNQIRDSGTDITQEAEVAVMHAMNGVRRWMLEKRVTSLPAAEQPTPEQIKEWREQLGKGVTVWPSCFEMATLYSAYMEAALGNTEEADMLFTQSLGAGRRDRFYISNAAYYCLLRNMPVEAFNLASVAHSAVSPGTHFMLGQSMRQVASGVRTLDLNDKKLAEGAEQLGQQAKDRGLIPSDTKVESLADQLDAAGRRLEDEALVRILHDSQDPELEGQRKKLPEGLQQEDNWWGPFVYLQHNRIWKWQSDEMDEHWEWVQSAGYQLGIPFQLYRNQKD